ncbi:MAG: hypothetical protein ACXWAT_08165 [Methylobacter sp.]
MLHVVAVLVVLAICLSAASDSFSYYGHEPFAFTYERSLVALLCGSFAAAHLYLVALKRLTTTVAVLFYPLCLILGLAASTVARGSGKDWAPASASEATYANIMGYGVIGLLVAACAASCYWAFVHSCRSNA